MEIAKVTKKGPANDRMLKVYSRFNDPSLSDAFKTQSEADYSKRRVPVSDFRFAVPTNAVIRQVHQVLRNR